MPANSSEITAGPGASDDAGVSTRRSDASSTRTVRASASPPPGSSRALSTVSSAACSTISSTASWTRTSMCTSPVKVACSRSGVSRSAYRRGSTPYGSRYCADGSARPVSVVSLIGRRLPGVAQGFGPRAPRRRLACRTVIDAAPGSDDRPATFDVVAIGSALVDVLTDATDEDLGRSDLVKGSMALVDLARAATLYGAMGPAIEVSGGSAANTAVGVAQLGGSVGFLGKVAADELGEIFLHDIAAAGVVLGETTPVVPSPDPADDRATGRCLVYVTGDGERTMATHLGVA